MPDPPETDQADAPSPPATKKSKGPKTDETDEHPPPATKKSKGPKNMKELGGLEAKDGWILGFQESDEAFAGCTLQLCRRRCLGLV